MSVLMDEEIRAVADVTNQALRKEGVDAASGTLS
eukprot:CAMPEP_0182518344 /NCGR_PEP_ID=MMETSP1321-20130603/44095_1 /TAXON_ID=91990 /ORGANISM="Bolidomonas sp., Strain RCC1657" /LENGTH=33 /DNA_ID= /DNA_START= /DNA_END= /DNA_ORIENTATION=